LVLQVHQFNLTLESTNRAFVAFTFSGLNRKSAGPGRRVDRPRAINDLGLPLRRGAEKPRRAGRRG